MVLSGVANRRVVLPRVCVFIARMSMSAEGLLKSNKYLKIFLKRRIAFDQALKLFEVTSCKLTSLMRLS